MLTMEQKRHVEDVLDQVLDDQERQSFKRTTPRKESPAEFVDRLIASCHEEYDDAPTFTEDHLRDALVSAISLIEGREPSAEDFVIARPVLIDFVDERLQGNAQPRVLPRPVPETPATDQEGGAA